MTATHSRFYLGPISSCAIRREDLLPALCECLGDLDYHGNPGGAYERACRFIRRISSCGFQPRSCKGLTNDQAEEYSELVSELQDLLNGFAPPYCYFGANGADFGFWRCGEWRQMAEEDGTPLEEPASGYAGEWFSITDHGNVTLYARENGQDRVVWSTV